jgi:hypothetical protein
MKKNDEYLWSGEGPIDADVARLEELLKPLGWRGGSAGGRAAGERRESAAGPRRWHWLAAGTLLAAACALLVFLLNRGSIPAPGPRLVHGSRALAPGTLFVAEDEGRSTLRLEQLGTLQVEQGSRLWVDRLQEDLVVLRLERGELSALVSVGARPGLFNIDTPATRCVDLGCAYDLTVEESGDTLVRVTLGRVAFQNGGAEAFVPAGALCRASRTRGAGTPFFPASSPELRATLADFDAAVEAPERRRLAARVCELALQRVDALPLWHLLQADDGTISAAAAQRLAVLAGAPVRLELEPGMRLDDTQRGEWREFLWPDPYR